MMLNESEKNDSISIRNFYARRMLRIFPAFYVYLVVAFAAKWLTEGWPSASALGDYLSAFIYTSNYRFATMTHVDHACWHTWALSVEEQFYLLWPWFLAAFQKDLRRLTHLLIAAIVLVDIYRVVLFFKFHVDDHWLSYTFDCRADHLLVGCLLAVLLKRGVLMSFWNLLSSRVWVSLVPFSLIVLSIVSDYQFHLRYKFAVGFIVDPLLTAIFLVQVVALGNSWTWRWLNWKVVRYIGSSFLRDVPLPHDGQPVGDKPVRPPLAPGSGFRRNRGLRLAGGWFLSHCRDEIAATQIPLQPPFDEEIRGNFGFGLSIGQQLIHWLQKIAKRAHAHPARLWFLTS